MRHHSPFRLAPAVAIALLTLPTSPLAQTLGTIEFPNSGSPAAQEPFIRGVLFLHSFEYDAAARAFKDAQQIDPGFVMAYWGEAMTYNHPIWNEKDPDAGRDALKRLEDARAANRGRKPTAREELYIDAVQVLYSDGPKERQDSLYTRAMERLTEAHPDDLEAKSFYALSLLGLSQGERNVATYMLAGSIAQEVFDVNREHPGAAHVLIHSFDDPVHAPLGLTAARAYSKIAPDAAHAQHMTSHIFVARGMWDDVVHANETAVDVVNRAREQRGQEPSGCGHYPEWLHYGYLQQGRFADAARVLEGCRAFVAQSGRGTYSLGIMRAANVIDTKGWDGPAAAISVATERIGETAYRVDFTTGLAAAMRGDLTTATASLDAMISRRTRSGDDGASPAVVLERTLRAAIWRAQNKTDQAIAELETAATLEETLPFQFGPPASVKPPRELLGEILLALDRPAEARRQFEMALARTPKRARALLGLARAAAETGETDRALQSYRELNKIWQRADRDLPELAEVRQYLAKYQKQTQ